MKTFHWLLKREFWEHKGGFFWAPIIAGALFVVLNIGALSVGLAAAGRENINIGLIKINTLVDAMDDRARDLAGITVDLTVLTMVVTVLMVTGAVVFFYLLGSLYEERRDRSVLFWKSLPVSDRETVLSKVVSATLVAPGIGAAAGLVTAFAVLLVIGIVLAVNGQNVFGLLFVHSHPLWVIGILLAAIPATVVWALPTVGWLMLCSVWARSKPFLWAVGLPIGAGILSTWFDLMESLSLPDSWFWTQVVGRMLVSAVPGSWIMWTAPEKLEGFEGNPDDLVGLFGFADVFSPLATTNAWIGAAIGIAMIVLAIRLRRWRDEG